MDMIDLINDEFGTEYEDDTPWQQVLLPETLPRSPMEPGGVGACVPVAVAVQGLAGWAAVAARGSSGAASFCLLPTSPRLLACLPALLSNPCAHLLPPSLQAPAPPGLRPWTSTGWTICWRGQTCHQMTRRTRTTSEWGGGCMAVWFWL
jgi:hypothetical protein